MPSRTSMRECCGVNDPCLTRGGVKVCPVCEKGPDRTVEEALDNLRVGILEVVPGNMVATRHYLSEELAALEAAVARQARQPLLDMLREMGWVNDTGCGGHCPVCSRYDHVGHTPDCRLGTILKECP